MPLVPKCLLIVSAEIDPEIEADWNRWYDDKHLPEILACPGFEQAARFVSEVDGEREYIAVYTLSDEKAMSGEMFNERRGWEQFAPNVTAEVRQFRMVSERQS